MTSTGGALGADPDRVPVAPVTVVIPTIGRGKLLEACLTSLQSCRPGADEVLVVDQSQGATMREIVVRFSNMGARLIECDGRGPSRARNRGLREARNEAVLFTDDDCRVEEAWIGMAWRAIEDDPERILSGRIRPLGNVSRVPTYKDLLTRRDYQGRSRLDAICSCNMAARRSDILELGGFDERLYPFEDVDLCYRHLRAGGRITYDPLMVVWHVDWRGDDELARVNINYWRNRGVFHAKYLRRHDLRLLRFMLRDVRSAGKGLARRLLRQRVWRDEWTGFVRGYLPGLRAGWRIYASGRDGD